MKKVVLFIFCAIFTFSLCSCGGSVSTEKTDPKTAAAEESDDSSQGTETEAGTTAAATNAGAEIPETVPESLVFSADGSDGYAEPVLGDWEAFLKKVFKSYEAGEVDPGSGITKYFGEGNDGRGYCFLVVTRSDQGEVISYNIDTAIVSENPNAGGDEASGQVMVNWMYETFGN